MNASLANANPRVSQSQLQKGLSLVELMIASLISMIIILALTELYAGMSRTNRELVKTSSQIENARFAMQFVGEDVIHAGYLGGYIPDFDDFSESNAPVGVPSAVPDPCLAYTTPWSADYRNGLLAIPIQVHSGTPGSCGAVVANKVANTDVLVVRHAETCAAGAVNCAAQVAGRLYLQISNCLLELEAGSPYVFSTGPYTLRERDCNAAGGGTIAPIYRFVQHVYYVRDYAMTPGDGIPSLVRSEFDLDGGGVLAQQSPQVLVEGIERFRVELGLDIQRSVSTGVVQYGSDYTYNSGVNWEDPVERVTPTNRGDGVPDTYVHCGAGCTVGQLINTVSLRVHLLARANTESPGYSDSKDYNLGGLTIAAAALDDAYKRHVFSSTYRLHNVSGRRETPLAAP
ncbi:PilW family protein [Parahaliea aestuarii]|uniref:Pilus assembly protein PilW n=1 Tax=Parahaliea aestuarii TaxID=1852021 RepID=A0A5C8ZNE2_9GAMM|nr:PilW family protein [Parahaliea aestuarii]TXS90013.1 pilus assembly protein PilW [Parahaliea aestuarii]